MAINMTHFFLGPLSIPILKVIFGSNLVHGMALSINSFYFRGDLISWLWFATTVIFSYLNPNILDEMAVIYLGTGSVIFLRLFMVSLKYGFFTKKKWELMKTTQVSQEFIFQNLIVYAWVSVPSKVAKKELAISFRKQKIKPEELRIQFSYFPQSCVLDKIPASESFESYSVVNNEVSLSKLAKYLVHKVTKTQKVSELQIIHLLGLVYVILFVVLRYYAFGWGGFRLNAFEIAYTLLSVYKGYTDSSQLVKFIAAGLYDFKRKRMLMAQCTGLISKVDHKFSLFKNTDMPQMDFTNSATILNWYHLRRTFLDFGKRYTLRVFLYASLILPLCISVVAMLILQVTGIIGGQYNYYLIPGFMLTIEVLVMLIYMSFAALSLNRTFAVHRDLILEYLITAKTGNNFNFEVISNLAFVMERLKHDEIVRPIRILGIVINDDLIVKLIIVAISGLLAIIKLSLLH